MKVFDILHILQKKDWHWLSKYVSSPAHNQHDAVKTLFSLLRKKLTQKRTGTFSEKKFTTLFKAEFPDTAKLHHVSNYLLRVTEDFLAWDAWKQDASAQALYRLQAYRDRQMEKPFRSSLKQVHQQLEAQALRNPEHFRFRYKLALEEYQQSMQAGRSDASQLQALSDWHDIAFIAEKLKNACILISRRRVLKRDFNTGMLAAVLKLVRAQPALLEYPAIAVYYFGYMALTEPEVDAHFFALKERLTAAGDAFPVVELRDVYLLAINFCIHRINLRQETWLREVFELYRAGIHTGVFFENGQLSRFTYTNIALAALRLQEFEWTLEFLNSYRNKLPETQQSSVYAFNLARFYCERGDYDRAMPLLQSMDFDDVLHNLTAKAMLLRMYYETGAINALDSLLDSLEIYLRRKGQLGEQQKTAYRTSIRFVRRLLALVPSDKLAHQQLRQEVVQTVLVAEKDWLLRMLADGSASAKKG